MMSTAGGSKSWPCPREVPPGRTQRVRGEFLCLTQEPIGMQTTFFHACLSQAFIRDQGEFFLLVGEL